MNWPLPSARQIAGLSKWINGGPMDDPSILRPAMIDFLCYPQRLDFHLRCPGCGCVPTRWKEVLVSCRKTAQQSVAHSLQLVRKRHPTFEYAIVSLEEWGRLDRIRRVQIDRMYFEAPKEARCHEELHCPQRRGKLS